jgi:hypothetical protein
MLSTANIIKGTENNLLKQNAEKQRKRDESVLHTYFFVRTAVAYKKRH